MARSVVGRRRWCFRCRCPEPCFWQLLLSAANPAEACERGQILEAMVETHGDATPPSRLALVPIRSHVWTPDFIFVSSFPF